MKLEGTKLAKQLASREEDGFLITRMNKRPEVVSLGPRSNQEVNKSRLNFMRDSFILFLLEKEQKENDRRPN